MAHTFVLCTLCGTEFQSAFAPVTSMNGCTEPCPACGRHLASPMVHGHFNFDAIKREFDEPMQRIYPDGEVFMGKGGLGLDLGHATIARFFPAYGSDIRRGLEVLDSFYKSDRSTSRQLLSYVYIQTWAAYEALIQALLNALVDATLVASASGRFEEKQNRVLEALALREGFPPSLAHLYAQRNCLAHKSGVVDEKLLKVLGAIIGSEPVLARLKLGAPLPIDAKSAVSFLDAAQNAARSLLGAAQAKL